MSRRGRKVVVSLAGVCAVLGASVPVAVVSAAGVGPSTTAWAIEPQPRSGRRILQCARRGELPGSGSLRRRWFRGLSVGTAGTESARAGRAVCERHLEHHEQPRARGRNGQPLGRCVMSRGRELRGRRLGPIRQPGCGRGPGRDMEGNLLEHGHAPDRRRRIGPHPGRGLLCCSRRLSGCRQRLRHEVGHLPAVGGTVGGPEVVGRARAASPRARTTTASSPASTAPAGRRARSSARWATTTRSRASSPTASAARRGPRSARSTRGRIRATPTMRCPAAAPDACTSVGSVAIVQQFALAEYWNGSTWVRQTTPAPDGRPDTTLTGVSCVGGTSCVAVGASARVNQMNGHSGRYRAMGEVWDGSSWSLSPVVGLAGAVLTLSAVSCRSPTACIAVGGSSTGTAESTIVEAYTG